MNRSQMIYGHVTRKIEHIYNSPDSSRIIAELRRGVSKDMSECYGTWAYILTGMPEEFLSKTCDDGASESEMAVYTALTLYALHQQSESDLVNVPDTSFGDAVGRLARTSDNSGGVRRRFDSVLTSNNLMELSHHVRGLIQLMKSSNHPTGFDYAMFARDLYDFQWPDGRRKVLFRWGEGFYRLQDASKDGESDSNFIVENSKETV